VPIELLGDNARKELQKGTGVGRLIAIEREDQREPSVKLQNAKKMEAGSDFFWVRINRG
jgi:hypothetical protein